MDKVIFSIGAFLKYYSFGVLMIIIVDFMEIANSIAQYALIFVLAALFALLERIQIKIHKSRQN